MAEFISQLITNVFEEHPRLHVPGLFNMVDFEPFSRQAECHNQLFLQNRHDQICVQLAR